MSNSAAGVWLTAEEACAELGIGRTTLFALVRQGKQGDPAGLPSVTVGRRRLIPAAAVRDFARRVEAEQTGRAYTEPYAETAV